MTSAQDKAEEQYDEEIDRILANLDAEESEDMTRQDLEDECSDLYEEVGASIREAYREFEDDMIDSRRAGWGAY